MHFGPVVTRNLPKIDYAKLLRLYESARLTCWYSDTVETTG